MTNKAFKASLIKYKETQDSEPIWFWINSATGGQISPQMKSEQEAEKWYDDMVKIHSETFTLLDRAKNGKFHTLVARINFHEMIATGKSNDCPIDVLLTGDILTAEVLGLNKDDARNRIEHYFPVIEWIE